MSLPTNECWECRKDTGYSLDQLEQLFELAHKTCPVAPPEQNSSICFDAFQAGGCTREMEVACLADLQEDEPAPDCPPESGGICDNCHSHPCQLDSLDAAIAAGPDDF